MNTNENQQIFLWMVMKTKLVKYFRTQLTPYLNVYSRSEAENKFSKHPAPWVKKLNLGIANRNK